MDHLSASTLLRAVADPVRLRLLHLLNAEELSVGELVRILELPQSSVSRHLKTLREEGLVTDRAAGPATYYRAALNGESSNGQGMLRRTISDILPPENLPAQDRRRLDKVLALRASERGEFFNQIGLQWDALRESCFGASFHLEIFLTLLPASWTVADLGTGTGYLLPHLARHFEKVVAVDSSRPMLQLAGKRVAAECPAADNIELHEGRLESLPLADGQVDLALLVLMLHHLDHLDDALAELSRITRPGGQALIVDYYPHTNATFQARMADQRPGIDPDDLARRLGRNGFRTIRRHELGQPDLPGHELAPLPRLYAITATRGKVSRSDSHRPAIKSKKPTRERNTK